MPPAIRSRPARLYTYFHSVHPLTSKLYDAVLLHGGGGRVSPDLNVKVFKYLDESDVIGQANSRIPDSNGYRQWEVAGSSHLDAQFSRSMAALGLRVSGMRPVEGSPAIAGLDQRRRQRQRTGWQRRWRGERRARTVDARSRRSAACRRITC